MRGDADHLADRIAEDLPEFTVHDGSHLDALWPLADLVSPTDLELTPTEAWVLGVAIILHDLGLAVAAYPGGREELRAAPGWPDARAAALRRRLGRTPSEAELGAEDADLDLAADATVLRQRHAERARELVNVRWDDQLLVVDPDLRNELGSTAGQIAASHWWSVEELATLGDLEGAPAGMPAEWTVRPILLAVLLRVADAAHLDAGRAPRFARAVRRPRGDSALHWEFQGRMRQPVLNGDRLQFVSSRPFPADQAEAWWLCLDHLRCLDEELSAADSLLQAHELPRLVARSVQGARDPAELARIVRPEGWEPVDARVEVSDVSKLIQRLGGEALYGTVEAVPVRELLQNASDAVRARRALQPGFEGAIEVRVSEDLSEISVRDFGVGMGMDVLTGSLLDFGRSLWESEELATVLPGLQAAGFRPTGRFGIGFFSAFMWAEEVEVVSRPWRAGEDETRALSFKAGPGSRPLLRRAGPELPLGEPGTLVRLRGCGEDSVERWLKSGLPTAGEQADPDALGATLAKKLGELAPALPVDLYAAYGDRDLTQVVGAEDWRTISPEELLARVRGGRRTITAAAVRGAAHRLDFIGAEDAPAGRAALDDRFLSAGVLVAGGLRVGRAPRIAGILVVDEVDAARQHGVSVARPEDVEEWATRQAAAFSARGPEEPRRIAAMVLSLGGDPGSLSLAASAEGDLDRPGIVSWAAERDEIAVLDVLDTVLDARDVQAIPPEPIIELGDDVLDVKLGTGSMPHGFSGSSHQTLLDEVTELVAKAWRCDRDDVEEWEVEREDLFDVAESEPVLAFATLLVRPGTTVEL
ncbi:MAG TPA: hypothetical protein VFY48_05310 [Solirubrobacterales bacterium]|nr:hypothetical protein [Solirubrobacterales bacterium]